jgi:hypothetical protein
MPTVEREAVPVRLITWPCNDSTQAPSACCSLAARTTSHCIYHLLMAFT